MSEQEQDERFAKIYQDPRFRTIRKKDKTVKIDNRFKSMFTDDKFTLKYSMDKRGRSKKHLISEDYKKFYRLEEDEDNKSEEKSVNELNEKDNMNDDEKCSEEQNDLKLTHSFGYHRGFNFKSKDEELDDESSSSSSESEEDEEEAEEVEHNWAELDKDAPQIDDATSRIAICNVDWDRINAQDLYVILNSFKPNTGTINSVKIYYSKFGEKRLQVEENKGPSEFIYGKGKIIEKIDDKVLDEEKLEEEEDDDNDDDDNDDDDNENDNDDFNNIGINDSNSMEKLRKYQLDRLKYFYAVVECESANTAEAIYNELDGMEYESSSTMLDIRYIPDDMNFDDVKLKEECTSMPNSMYKAPLFTNTALHQSNVKITWDETDPKRTDAFNKVFEEGAEDDIKVYLASSSSEDEDDNTNSNIEINENISEAEKINKYKNLISMLDKENEKDDYDLEVSWEPSLKSKIPDKSNSDEEDEAIEKKESDTDNSSSENEFDEKLMKPKSKKEKYRNKNKRKEEVKNENTSDLELLMMDMDDDDTKKKHFNYNEIVENFKKGTNKDGDDDDGFKVSF